MKIEIEFGETQAWSQMQERISHEVMKAQTAYQLSMRRYIAINRELKQYIEDTLENIRMRNDLHAEADEIEATWKRWGIEF